MKVTDVLGCACSASILLLVSAWVPIFGPLFSLLIPLPFLYYTSKSGLNQGVMIVVISLLTVVFIAKLMGFPEVLFLCLELGLLGLIAWKMLDQPDTNPGNPTDEKDYQAELAPGFGEPVYVEQ